MKRKGDWKFIWNTDSETLCHMETPKKLAQLSKYRMPRSRSFVAKLSSSTSRLILARIDAEAEAHKANALQKVSS